MSRTMPDGVRRVGEILETQHGYLRNVVREPGTTCAVCSAPVDGFPRCYQCNQHQRSGIPIADRVASIVYAVERPADQTYTIMRGYKNTPPIATHTAMVQSLLLIGYAYHAPCPLRLAGATEFAFVWATVPSLRENAGPHPLNQIVRTLTAGYAEEVRLVRGARVDDPRALRPDNFAVEDERPTGKHVILVDDSWVSGGHGQSAAGALKAAGAASVSLLIVARVLDRGWAPSERFIRERFATTTYSPDICPWTGTSECP